MHQMVSEQTVGDPLVMLSNFKLYGLGNAFACMCKNMLGDGLIHMYKYTL